MTDTAAPATDKLPPDVGRAIDAAAAAVASPACFSLSVTSKDRGTCWGDKRLQIWFIRVVEGGGVSFVLESFAERVSKKYSPLRL